MTAPRVVLTGASSGIGRAIAVAWGKRGASLVLSARDGAALEEVAREVRDRGGEAFVEAGDVTREADRERLVARALEERSGIDVLVNNAGRGYYAPFASLELAEVESIFALNVFAPLRLTQLALPHLAASRGAVCMMSSIAGVAAAPKMGAYAATKFALEALSTALRAEVAKSGVRVVVVRPGPVDTPFRANSFVRDAEAGVRPKGSRAQSAEAIAEQTIRAIETSRAVVETSFFVRVGSFASRVVPPVFRAVTARMAAKEAAG